MAEQAAEEPVQHVMTHETLLASLVFLSLERIPVHLNSTIEQEKWQGFG